VDSDSSDVHSVSFGSIIFRNAGHSIYVEGITRVEISTGTLFKV